MQMFRPKKNVKITADVRQKNVPIGQKGLYVPQKMKRILEMIFCENKIVEKNLVFICFPGFEE